MNERHAATILVVDDSEQGRTILRANVERLGHRCIEAVDGVQAVGLFEREQPDLVLMDIVMPQMDGYEATRRIKRLCGNSWTPVVMLSALSEESDVIAGFNAGADDYIVRPLGFRLFAARIGALLKGVEAERRRAALVGRLEATGDAIIDGLITLDGDGVVVDCNAAARRIFACGEAQLVGRPLPLLAAASATGPADGLAIGGEAGAALPALDRTHEMRGRRGDGQVFPLEIGLSALPGNGRSRLIAVVRDVSERKAGEARLRESLEKLSLLYHSSELGLALCDLDGRFVQCNGSFAQILDYPEAALIGRALASVTPAEYAQQDLAQMAELQRSGRFGPYEKEFVRQDGSRVPVLLHGSRIVGADGEQYIWSVVQDISQRKRIEREQREAAERLQRYRDETEYEAELAKQIIERQLQMDALHDPRLRYSVVPAREFSGDVVTAARSPARRLYVMLADATGHGLAAAISLLPILSLFYRRVAQDVAMPTLVAEINTEVQRVAPVGRFVAAALLCIDEDNGSGEIWVGGTPAALLLDEHGRVVERFRSRQLPLGILDSTPLVARSQFFDWTERRQIVLMSDGLLEAQAPDGSAFEEAGALRALRSAASSDQRLAALQGALAAHLGQNAPFDDMSVVIVDCLPVAAATTA